MKKFNIHNWQAEYLKEGSCGYTQDTDGKNLSTPGGTKGRSANSRTQSMREAEEDSFDARLAKQMGMSDDEFEDQIASRDIGDGGSPFPGTDEVSNGYKAAAALKDELRYVTYKKLSQEEIDTFSKEMVLHFLDNTTAAAAAKIHFGKKEI